VVTAWNFYSPKMKVSEPFSWVNRVTASNLKLEVLLTHFNITRIIMRSE
jgi:hypothetical protein